MPIRGRLVVAILFGLCELGLLFGAKADFATVRAPLDAYGSGGKAEAYTPELHAHIGSGLRLVAIGVFIAGGFGTIFLPRISSAIMTIRRDAVTFGRDIGHCGLTRREWGVVVLITFVGFLFRMNDMSIPLRYDEAETYLSAVIRPWFVTVSSYYAPNNHVFHSVLAKISCGVFGGTVWALRLPALLAGLALIPATYVTTCALAGREVCRRDRNMAATMAAFFVAVSVPLSGYSVDARGYSLVALFWLISVLLARYCLATDNAAAWAGLPIVFAFGLWTIPTMLYAVAGIDAWIVLNRLAPHGSRPWVISWSRLVLCNVFAALATVVLYSPVLVVDGPAKLFQNQFVTPRALSDVAERLPDTIAVAWNYWHTALPPGFEWGLTVIAGVGVVSLGRYGTTRYPVWFIGWSVLLGMSLMQRVIPFPKFFLHLLPTYYAEAMLVLVTIGSRVLCFRPDRTVESSIVAKGHSGTTADDGTALDHTPRTSSGRFLVSACAFVAVCSLLTIALRDTSLKETNQTGGADQVTQFLRSRLQEGDLVVSTIPTNAPLEYYFLRAGLPRTSLLRHHPAPAKAERVFVVTNTRSQQTIDSVLLDSALISELSRRAGSAEFSRIAEFTEAEIYFRNRSTERP